MKENGKIKGRRYEANHSLLNLNGPLPEVDITNKTN